LPTIATSPVLASIMSVNLSIRVAVVGPAGPTTFVAHGIDRSDVIDHAIGEIDARRQRLVLREEIGDPLVRGVAPGEELARKQKSLPGFHCATSAGVSVSRFTRRDVGAGVQETSGHRRRSGGSSFADAGAVETKCACRVAAQLGISATGFDTACVG
jgi:hypothetical protein